MTSTDFTTDELQRIEKGVTQKYARVASSPEGLFRFPTGRAGLNLLGYDAAVMRSLPEPVMEYYCGVGNPFSLGTLSPGEAVLDIGCGAGVDSLIAALLVGPGGRVVGIDMSPHMVERAKRNLALSKIENVTFLEAGAESLPFPDEDFHVVISNGVFNLVPHKGRALREVFRVLKPGGRLMIADQFLAVAPPGSAKPRIDNWAN